MRKNKKLIDFTKHPYRGVFKDVAKKLKITPQAVRQSYHRHNVNMVSLVNKEIKHINNIIKDNDQLSREANEFRISRAM